ncbi:hypothetical protein LSAT2_002833 [Lamellibrachia satsuma]|nr:hypothetical protein LSAT2_002833 [Lamellibrachia satsuma]
MTKRQLINLFSPTAPVADAYMCVNESHSGYTYGGEVVLPVIDVESVVVDRVAVNTSDREEVVAEVDTADREEVVVDTAGLEKEVAFVDTADREEVVVGEVDTADRVEIIGEEDTADREEIVAMFDGAVALGADRTFEEVDTADFGDISRMAGFGKDVEAEVIAAGVTFSEESTGSSDDTRVVICVESSDTESTRVLRDSSVSYNLLLHVVISCDNADMST